MDIPIRHKRHVKVPIVDTLPAISTLQDLYNTINRFEYPIWIIFEYGNDEINLHYKDGYIHNPRQFINTLNCSNIPEEIPFKKEIFITGVREKDTFYALKYHMVEYDQDNRSDTSIPFSKEKDWFFLTQLGFDLITIRTCYAIDKVIDYVKEVNRSVILIDNRFTHYRPMDESDKDYFLYIPKEAIHSTVLTA